MEFIALIKAAWTVFIGWMSAVFFYFLPIKEIINGLLIAFALSFIFGVIASLRVQNESLNLKKAITAFKEIAIYLLILASLFTIGDKMQSDAFVFELMGTITWGLIYLYFTNMTKNLSRLMPNSRGVKYLHYVLALEFLKKAPSIKEFEENERTN